MIYLTMALFSEIFGDKIFVGLCVFSFLWALMFWKIFEKAGEKGYKSIIPFYNVYILIRISREKYSKVYIVFLIYIVFFLSMIFLIGSIFKSLDSLIASLVVFGVIFGFLYSISIIGLEIFYIQCASAVAKVFGKNGIFTIGCIFLPFIFFPIIGYGKSQYMVGKFNKDGNIDNSNDNLLQK